MSVSVCVTFVVSTGCESCTRPISTNPGSMEAGECGITRGMCFAARRLELVAVAGRLWISWCVLGGAYFFGFFVRFFPSNAHGLLQVRGHLASCTRLLVMRQDRESEATEVVFCLQAKKSLHIGVRFFFFFFSILIFSCFFSYIFTATEETPQLRSLGKKQPLYRWNPVFV